MTDVLKDEELEAKVNKLRAELETEKQIYLNRRFMPSKEAQADKLKEKIKELEIENATLYKVLKLSGRVVYFDSDGFKNQ